MTGHDDGTRRGYPEDLAADEPLPSGAAEPVDIAQVRADEALIEALRGSLEPDVDDPIDDRLASLLQAWRDDVDDEPIRPIDLDVAIAALTPATPPRRRRYPIGIASAAAAVVAVLLGVMVAANGVEPDSPLFAITKVVNPERAQSLQAAATVRRKLAEASSALNSGEVGRASSALEEAKQTLSNVRPDDDKDSLESEANQLEDMIEHEVLGGGVTTTVPTASSATVPGAPPAATPTATPPTQPSGSDSAAAPTTTTTPTPPDPTGTESPVPTSSAEAPTGGGEIGGGESATPGSGSELGGGGDASTPSEPGEK